jgi:hypothetical protein
MANSKKFIADNGIETTELSIDGLVVANANGVIPEAVLVRPHGTVTATDLQSAIEQLADNSFRSSTQPAGANIEEGDTWYNPANNNFYVYRETAANVFEWVPIMVGNISPTSDVLDGGAF